MPINKLSPTHRDRKIISKHKCEKCRKKKASNIQNGKFLCSKCGGTKKNPVMFGLKKSPGRPNLTLLKGGSS